MAFAIDTRSVLRCFLRATRAERRTTSRTSPPRWTPHPVCLSIVVAWLPTTADPYDPIPSTHLQPPGFLYCSWSYNRLRPCGHWYMCMGSIGCRSKSSLHPSKGAIRPDHHAHRRKFKLKSCDVLKVDHYRRQLPLCGAQY